ncbi:MAG: addiction module protein [Pirellulales bacterium]|nr:addiction module protein [Pirellulales bacterium]
MSTEIAAPTQLERLTMELLGLPTATRARLAEQLIKSLEPEEYPPQEAVKRRQMEVVGRRVADFESGKTQGIPAEDVFREIEEEIE